MDANSEIPTSESKKSKLDPKIIFFIRCLLIIIAVTVLILSGILFRGMFDPLGRSNDKIPSTDKTVRVMIVCAQNAQDPSQDGTGHTFDIEPGGNAELDISVPDGFIAELTSGKAELTGSHISVKDVFLPQTVSYIIRPVELYKVRLFNDGNCGTVTSDKNLIAAVIENTSVTFSLTESKGFKFIGYSLNKPLADGGELISESKSFSFTPTADSSVYTNYYSTEKFTINYNANGGKIKDANGENVLTEYASSEFYFCPNARINDGKLYRDGHILVGYNTKADGSGAFYACGWNIIMPEDKHLTLYAVWMEETPSEFFKYRVEGNGNNKTATVTNCSSNAGTVVVPEFLDGIPVKKLVAGSFNALPLKTLVLPTGLSSVEARSVTSCSALTDIYLFDKVVSLPDTALQQCNSFSTLKICAARLPVYHGTKHGTYSIKFERLYTAEKPKIIIVNGSNTAYGLDTPEFVKLLDGKYDVANFGFNWKTPLTIFIEASANYIKPGDILLMCPELQPQMWGENTASTTMWELFESAYEVLSMIDFRNYKCIFSTFGSFNQKCLSSKGVSYDEHYKYVNTYGDYTAEKAANQAGDSYVQTAGRHYSVDAYLKIGYYTAMNRALDAAIAAGAKAFMSFPPTNRNCLTEQSLNEEYQDFFAKTVESLWHIKIISKLKDYIAPGGQFFDSDYHLSTEATKWRTEKLAYDLRIAIEGLR